MSRGFILAMVVLLVFGLLFCYINCSSEEGGGPGSPRLREKEVGELVRKVLESITLRRGSKIWFTPTELQKGTQIEIKPGPGSGDEKEKPVTLSESGYLIFIDEQPGYDWVHAAKLVFFRRDQMSKAVVLFRDKRPSMLAIKNAQGKDISVTWKDL